MKNNIILYSFLTILLGATCDVWAQPAEVRIPSNINRSAINNFAPFVSGDGRTMIFLNDYSEDKKLILSYSRAKIVGAWDDPVDFPIAVNIADLNFQGGYGLSHDGNTLYTTMNRSGGVGGFDIWYSTWDGKEWSRPVNEGMPVNSQLHDGAPSITPDGQIMYFMRCQRMSTTSAEGCQIMVTKRGARGMWDEPEALPEMINTGNAQMPKILSDSRTLIFAAELPGGKGGLDLYQTRKTLDGWTDPVPMTFLNSEHDDLYVSIPARGLYAYIHRRGERTFEVAGVLIPEAQRPDKVIDIRGTIVDKNTKEPIPAFFRVHDVPLRDRFWYSNPNPDGTFFAVLPEGTVYDLAIEPSDASYMYYSKLYPLEELRFSLAENLEVELEKVAAGKEYFSSGVGFKPEGGSISEHSVYELRRMARMIRSNQDKQFEIRVHLLDYRENEVPRQPDMTMVVFDTLYIEQPDTFELVYPSKDSLEVADSAETVSDANSLDLHDSPMIVEPDTVFIKREPLMEIHPTFHNDHTLEEAGALRTSLVQVGIPEEIISIKGTRNTPVPFESISDQEAYEKKEEQSHYPARKVVYIRVY